MDAAYKPISSYSFFRILPQQPPMQTEQQPKRRAVRQNVHTCPRDVGTESAASENNLLQTPIRCEQMKLTLARQGYDLAQSTYGAAQYQYHPMRRIAAELAVHTDLAAPLISAYRVSSSQNCRPVSVNLNGMSASQAVFLRSLFADLAQAGFFQAHSTLTGQLRLCAVRNSFLAGFIGGGYLESWLYRQAQLVLGDLPVKRPIYFEVLPNAHMMRRRHTVHELDMLLLVDGKLYILEAKSGDISRSALDPLLDAASKLGIPASHCLVICPGKQPAQRSRLAQATGVNVCGVSDFSAALQRMVLP